MMTPLHIRRDGTFVITLNGMPYHVTLEDPLHAEAAALDWSAVEPEPVPDIPAQSPLPTRAELMTRLTQLQAMIESLPGDGNI